MIEQVLFFGLGALSAAMLWLILLPAFWRRATRLTRLQIERSLPLTPNEFAAAQDRLRAEHAVRIARMESRIEQVRAEIVQAKGETGERLLAESALLDTIAERERLLATREVEATGLREQIAALEAELAAVAEARALAEMTLAGLEMQRDALTAKLHPAIDLAEDRRLALDDARAQITHLTENLEAERHRAAELRTELQEREVSLRELERRAAALENNLTLSRIRRGEGSEAASVEREAVARAR